MILGNFNNTKHKLLDGTTVKNFIENVIDKDKDKEFKYYYITLKKQLPGRNMVLYYQDSILKSHHTTYIKMDYNDYLDYEIMDTYDSDYIATKNVVSFEKDYYKEHDSNKPQKIINKECIKEKIDKIFEDTGYDNNKVLAEYETNRRIQLLEDENQRLSSRIKWLEYKMNLLTSKN